LKSESVVYKTSIFLTRNSFKKKWWYG